MIRRLNENSGFDTYEDFFNELNNCVKRVMVEWKYGIRRNEFVSAMNQITENFSNSNYFLEERCNRKRNAKIKESNNRHKYYDPELDQFELFFMTRGTDGHDEIRDYVNSHRDTGIFGSIGSEYGNISIWVNTNIIDDDFINEVEDLIIFAQDLGVRLNVPCYNELKDLLTVKHAPYDI